MTGRVLLSLVRSVLSLRLFALGSMRCLQCWESSLLPGANTGFRSLFLSSSLLSFHRQQSVFVPPLQSPHSISICPPGWTSNPPVHTTAFSYAVSHENGRSPSTSTVVGHRAFASIPYDLIWRRSVLKTSLSKCQLTQ